ncbi:MAG: iron uptake transporter permease EfeU [Rhizobiaceae bacterium]
MLATFVIGLREGLEAALIVGIIAAFLRKNGKSLTAMWFGVLLAILLSIAVGVGLKLVEKALPQAAQEGMEAVIGAIAIFFVTGMIVWMNAHARDMKRQIEAEAADALGQASAYALALMAFLAVLKEGFETSVFLLATFSAAQSASLAAAGAVIGLLLSAVIGWGIYMGGVRINLSRFFRVTGAFLILVAAGLVITCLRTAHEAGWLNAGQQATVNLSWLVAPGSIQSALITGVLGIPADPRLVEVLGWFAYLIPVSLFIYWPPARRLGTQAGAKLKLAIAGGLVAVALGLALIYPVPQAELPTEAPLVAGTGGSAQPVGTARLEAAGSNGLMLKVSTKDGSASLPLTNGDARQERHEGIEASAWTIHSTGTPAERPSSLTLDEVVALAGGRIPVGFSPSRNPGPFTAEWSARRSTEVWAVGGTLLDASDEETTVVTLSDGGLRTPRTLTVRNDAAGGWQVSATYRDAVVAKLNAVARARTERHFWAVQLPFILAIIALLLAASAGRTLMQEHRRAGASANASISKPGRRAENSMTKGVTHAAH